MCTARLAPFISPSIARRTSPVLFGGSDAHNMIIPLGSEYAGYASGRGTLAIPEASVIPVCAGVSGRSFGFHPSMPGLANIFNTDAFAPRDSPFGDLQVEIIFGCWILRRFIPLRINEIGRVRRGINVDTALRDNFFCVIPIRAQALPFVLYALPDDCDQFLVACVGVYLPCISRWASAAKIFPCTSPKPPLLITRI